MLMMMRRVTAIRVGLQRDRVTYEAVSPAESASLLYVCTANICRSPMAERLTRAELFRRFGAAAGIAVSSAGVAARDGAPMDETAARTLTVLGADPAGFVARPLAAEQVTDAALVLVAEREHRAVVARLVPRAVRRCFTVREFDRYLTTVDPAELPDDSNVAARLAALVEQVNLHRGRLPPVGQDEDDLADPYLQGPEAMQACAEQLVGCITRWVALLAGAAQPQLAQIEEVDVGD